MKAFIRQSSWSYLKPEVVWVELEVDAAEYEKGGVFSGDYVEVSKEPAWDRLKRWLGGLVR